MAAASPDYLITKIMKASEFEIHSYHKLDRVLEKLCNLVSAGQERDADKYGMVAAAVMDTSNNLVMGLNLPAGEGKRRHAERVAIDKYISKHGEIPKGSIVITTLSPCSEHMDERYGESCTDLLNQHGIKKVYAGYMDPTQEEEQREFNIIETRDKEIRNRCKEFADTFLDNNLKENWGVEIAPTNLNIGDYLDPESEYADTEGKKDPLELVSAVEEIINKGVRPKLRIVKPSELLATQDWLSNSTGDGALFPEYNDKPVVYLKGQRPYILDGHHRCAAALKRNQSIEVYLFKDSMLENFADGRNPQDKGDSKRYNVPTKGSISSLRKIAKQGGRRGQLAHWMANMKSGRKK